MTFKAFLTSMMILLVMFSAVQADDLKEKVKVTGEIRARFEGDNKDFNSDTKLYHYGLLRTRINLDFYSDSPVRAFIQVQDSRMAGDSLLGSGRLDNDPNTGLHQAFMQVKHPNLDGLEMKFGRFEYAKGNQRVLGAVGWSNVGRTWDGAVLAYQGKSFRGEVFAFEINEGIPQVSDDIIALGTYVEVLDPGMEFFLIWDKDNDRDLDDAPFRSRFTLGLYRQGHFSQFDYITNLAYQFGKTQHDSLDIAAYLATFEMGYTFDMEENLRIAAGADITSGDDDATDDKYKAYDNLFYTGHAFRGHMDYFVGSPMTGLNDLYLKASIQPCKKMKFNGHFHMFQTNVDYASVVDGSMTKSLGSEIDFSVTRKCYDRFKLDAGVSAFMPSEDWRGKDADTSLWMYIQATTLF